MFFSFPEHLKQFVPYIVPYVSESHLISSCVVLSTAANIAPTVMPDTTFEKLKESFGKIEGKLDIILKTPIYKAIDEFKFVLESVLSENNEMFQPKITSSKNL